METLQTLKALINDRSIVIPIIQRDYAQGREEEYERRNDFLNAIFEALVTDKNLNLDFVYGRTNEMEEFIPLDGQQRLTTLFLIYWFFYRKVNRYDEIKKNLRGFKYKTRISSERFCQMLVDLQMDLSLSTIPVSTIIKESPKFDESWQFDPTIRSMLCMIDAIAKKASEPTYADYVENMCRRLDEGAISFDLLDMGKKEFRLTDELYIKMNARGKQLTDFENFKATFIDFLDKKHDNSHFNISMSKSACQKTLKKYFAHSIEHEWTDLFWSYAFQMWNEKNSDDKEKSKFPIIDYLFMEFFKFVLEVKFFIKNTKAEVADFKASKEQWMDIFSDEDNIVFLFNSLYLFSTLGSKEKINNFFQMIFNGTEEDISIHLFEEKENHNLFERCIFNENFEVLHKLLLYFILVYCNKQKSYDVNDGLRDFVRVCRNLLLSINQTSKNSINVVSNIRINEIARYDSIFSSLSEPDVYQTLISMKDKKQALGENLQHECEKAILIKQDMNSKAILQHLEENDIFEGCLKSLLPLNVKNLQQVKEAIDLFCQAKSDVKARLLVAYGYKGYCVSYDRRFYGQKQRWGLIFRRDFQNVKKPISQFIEHFKIDVPLENMIEDYWKEYSTTQVEYYILKYPDFINAKLESDPCRYFYYSNEKDTTNIIAMSSLTSQPLSAYHIDPFVYLVKERLKHSAEVIDKYTGRFSSKSPLIFKNNVGIYAENGDWNFYPNDLPDETRQKLETVKHSADYQDKDMIEKALLLISSILNNNIKMPAYK